MEDHEELFVIPVESAGYKNVELGSSYHHVKHANEKRLKGKAAK